MKWSRLADQAKKVVDSRGGTDGLKRDAEKLRDIATGHGTAKDKAQRAADHLKQSPKRPEAGDETRQPPQADSGPGGS
jgi:hypothetical protein